MRWVLALFLFSQTVLSWAGLHEDWLSVYKLTQRHPIYRSGEPIQRPQGTYQLLMALHSVSPEGVTQRDCVWYQLPSGETLGVLKIIRSQQPCRDWQAAALWEITDVRSLSFKLTDHSLAFEYTNAQAQLKIEKFRLLNLVATSLPERFQSSTPKRVQRGVFFLAPQTKLEKLSLSAAPIGSGVECSFAEGTCQRCREGVVRVLDPDRPRFKCGIDRCGEKNELACLRGFEWKREREKPTCRRDPWHLYCQQGLRLECEGELGFCR